MTFEESTTYFKSLVNFETISCTNGPGTLSVENKKSVTISEGKSSKKSYNMIAEQLLSSNSRRRFSLKK
jgi:hypothetical protein